MSQFYILSLILKMFVACKTCKGLFFHFLFLTFPSDEKKKVVK